MIPKTEFEKHIMNIDWSLRPLPESYKRIAINECQKKYAFRRNESVCHCLCCGGKFDYSGNEKQHVCPHCGKVVEVVDTAKRVLYSKFYWNLLDTFKGLQVLRGFYIETKAAIGKPYEATTFVEVARTYFKSDGEYVNLSYPYVPMSWNATYSMDSSKMSFDRQGVRTITLTPHIRKLIPELKRIGYINLDCDAIMHISSCLADDHYQTLIEAKQYDFALGYLNDRLYKYWKQICLCMRNKYVPSDILLWRDMLKSIEELGLDMHSPHYVCPANLLQAHDQMMARVERKRIAEHIEKERGRLAEIQKAFAPFENGRKLFADLEFTEDDIVVVPLLTIREYLVEGEAMHHCVYTNGYYKHNDCLILSAKDSQGNRIATIEYNMKRKEVVQVMGKHNAYVEEKGQIESLILQNKRAIQKRWKQLEKVIC